MEQKTTLEQTQKLLITAELKQSIKVLTLPALELVNYIQQELETNPVLELVEEEIETVSETEETDPELEELFDDSSDLGNIAAASHGTSPHTLSPIVIQHASLHDYLKFQLNVMETTENQYDIGEYIIECLSDEGYLTVSTEEIAAALKEDLTKIESVLRKIQALDPPGVGARDLAECLKLQLDQHHPRFSSLMTMIDQHLSDIASNRVNQIARSLKLTVDETVNLVSIIKSLDPKPGLKYPRENTVDFIIPDVVIERVGKDYVVLVNDTVVPRLHINSYYRNMVKGEEPVDENTRKWVEGKLNSALWMVRSIEQRRNTLYKVATAVVEAQRKFFDEGISHLVPLTMKEIAEKVGVHESTVSRAVSNKYVQTPRGTFSWKFFFVGRVSAMGGDMATPKIKQLIRELISGENPFKPYSDQELTEMLTNRDIPISRRTVAKYREELGIPSSSKRKKFPG